MPLSAEPQPSEAPETVPAEGLSAEPADPALGETAPMFWAPYCCESSDTMVARQLCLLVPRLRHECGSFLTDHASLRETVIAGLPI